jgi:hypothetical protein
VIARRLTAVAAALAACALLAACGDDDDDERISASAPDFSVDLPEGWEAQDSEARERAGEIGVDAVGEDLGIPEDAQFSLDVQALWSVTEASDDFTTNINVFAEPLGEFSPQEYLEFSRAQLERTPFAGEVGRLEPGPEVDGDESQGLEYTSAQQGLALRLRLVSIFHDDSAYNVTLTALEEDFADASADLDAILESWTWN